MNSPQSFGLDDMLEQCLDLIERGASIEDCVARFPSHANELREMLSLALDLNAITPPLMSRAQMLRIQNEVLRRIEVPSSWWERLISRQLVLVTGAVAAMIIIVAGLVFALNREEPSEATMVAAVSVSPETEQPIDTITAVALDPTTDATEVPTETEIPPLPTDIPPSETAIEATETDTPTIEPSATDTSTVVPTEEPDESAAALPVYIDYAGQVSAIDTETGEVEIDEVRVALDEANLGTVEVGEYIVVSGLLDDNGLLTVDVIQETTVDAIEEENRQCEFTDESEPDRICHPVLLILSDAFQVSYDELDALHDDGFGDGEISRLYLIAEEAETDIDEIIQLRQEGLNWAEIIELFRDLSPSDLALGIVIGNGRGQTIRPDLDGARIYAGSTGNPDGGLPGNQTNNNPDHREPNTPVPSVNTVPPSLPTSESPTSPPDIVTICHNGNTITVDWDAWINAHSQHGDTLGACE